MAFYNIIPYPCLPRAGSNFNNCKPFIQHAFPPRRPRATPLAGCGALLGYLEKFSHSCACTHPQRPAVLQTHTSRCSNRVRKYDAATEVLGVVADAPPPPWPPRLPASCERAAVSCLRPAPATTSAHRRSLSISGCCCTLRISRRRWHRRRWS